MSVTICYRIALQATFRLSVMMMLPHDLLGLRRSTSLLRERVFELVSACPPVFSFFNGIILRVERDIKLDTLGWLKALLKLKDSRQFLQDTYKQ